MNILVIPSWYYDKKNPIKGSFFREHAIMLKNGGHQVAIIKVDLHKSSDSIPCKLEKINDGGIKTYIFHIKSYGFGKNAFLLAIIILHYYNRLLKELMSDGFLPDIIQAHSFFPAGYCACKIGKKINIPVVVTEHSSKVHQRKLGFFERLILLYTVKNSDKFVCVSNSLKKVVEQYSKKKDIYVIPNNLSSIFRYYHCKDSNKIRFVCVGNLIESKRQKLLIECFKSAFSKENVELAIVGIGPNRDALQHLANDLGVKEKVKFLGLLKREDVATLLNHSHIFALLSVSETFGVSYIEALACGCPVLATKNGGAEDIVNCENGLIFPVDDREAIVNGLKDIYRMYNSYNLDNISNQCYNLFGEKNIYYKTINLYKEAKQEWLRNK